MGRIDPADVSSLVEANRRKWSSRSFLACLSPEALRRLCVQGSAEWFDPGEELIVEAANDRTVYLVLSGCVKIVVQLDGGKEGLIAIRGSGDVIGELASLDRQPRSATARISGAGPSLVLLVNGDAFMNAFADLPDAVEVLAVAISGKLRDATSARQYGHLGSTTTQTRLARAFVALADTHGQVVSGDVVMGLDLSQEEMASLAGASVPSVQRALGSWRRLGVVGGRGRRLVIRDIAALRRIAYPSNDV
ncbi:Crp/Fnr family transcriptional regulator [Lentzea sp. BCCO 10_0061]|uniref:Crp/Fnr family transcriptional regulator n=1 Tax=Lentzea sokolovensis TaxID=3095429 RepID=A0ABU4VCH8_9PSEU|nr:Crp/Fnr family transcriptional regulator [Lentzea sp. BCCO 10_0061]MDX8149517.1 Crp/Fnr family transcriptional regulator [Lentzea sp. BCCO 10_0061]